MSAATPPQGGGGEPVVGAWQCPSYPSNSFGLWGRADLFARDIVQPPAGAVQALAAAGAVSEVAYDDLTEVEWATGELIDPYGDGDPYYQVAGEQVRALEEQVWSLLIWDEEDEDLDLPTRVRSLTERQISHLLINGFTTVLISHDEVGAWLARADAAIAGEQPAQAVVGADRYEVAAHLLTAALNAGLEAPIVIWQRGRGR